MEWQAPRRQLLAAFVCSPTKGKHVSFILTGFDKMSQTVKQHWRNVFSPLLAQKEAEILMTGMLLIQRKAAFLYFFSPLILTRGSTWRVQVKVLPVRSCRRLQPSDKVGINNLERNLGSTLLTVVTERLSDTSLGDIKERNCLMVAQPPFFSSPSNPIPTISWHAGVKAAASSPLHPVCTWSVLQSSSWQGCATGTSLGEALAVGCGMQPARRGAQSTLSYGAGEKSWVGYCALLPKWPAAATAMLCAIVSSLTLLPCYYILPFIQFFPFPLKIRWINLSSWYVCGVCIISI